MTIKNYFILSPEKLWARTGTTRAVQCLTKNLAFAKRRIVTKVHCIFVEKPYSPQSFLQNLWSKFERSRIQYRIQLFCFGRHLKFVNSYTLKKTFKPSVNIEISSLEKIVWWYKKKKIYDKKILEISILLWIYKICH